MQHNSKCFCVIPTYTDWEGTREEKENQSRTRMAEEDNCQKFSLIKTAKLLQTQTLRWNLLQEL